MAPIKLRRSQKFTSRQRWMRRVLKSSTSASPQLPFGRHHGRAPVNVTTAHLKALIAANM